MHPVLCTNTHVVTDFVNHDYLENGKQLFYETKKCFACASDGLF